MQLFTNNAKTTLSAGITNVATSMVLASGTGFPIPTGTDYAFLTLTDGTLYEVVKCTGGTGTTRYVTRAQEGTTALAWDAGDVVMLTATAGTLDRAAVAGPKVMAKGVDALDLSITSTASGATGNGAVVIGNNTAAEGVNAVAIGAAAMALGDDAMAIGPDAYAETTALRAIALGKFSSVMVPDTFNVSLMHAATNSSWNGGENAAFTINSTGEMIGMSAPLDFTGTLTYAPTFPAGITFYPTEVGVIVANASAVTVQPVVRFGITGDAQKHIADTATSGLTAPGKRHRFGTLLAYDGESVLAASVVTAATATSLQARFYWRGFAVLDEGI